MRLREAEQLGGREWERRRVHGRQHRSPRRARRATQRAVQRLTHTGPRAVHTNPVAHALAEVDDARERVIDLRRITEAVLVVSHRLVVPSGVDELPRHVEVHLRVGGERLRLQPVRDEVEVQRLGAPSSRCDQRGEVVVRNAVRWHKLDRDRVGVRRGSRLALAAQCHAQVRVGTAGDVRLQRGRAEVVVGGGLEAGERVLRRVRAHFFLFLTERAAATARYSRELFRTTCRLFPLVFW